MDNWQPDGAPEDMKAGDFEKLYETCFTPVFRYIFLRVRNRAEAEDLAQTVFLKAYQANPSSGALRQLSLNYFFTVARNTVIDHWRKKKEVLLDEPEEAFEAIPDHETPEDGAMRGEAVESVREALQYASQAEQEVLVLRFMNQLSSKEIAAITGKSNAAVRQLQSRGLKTLRRHLKQKGT